jgi:hypothetical protein
MKKRLRVISINDSGKSCFCVIESVIADVLCTQIITGNVRNVMPVGTKVDLPNDVQYEITTSGNSTAPWLIIK